MTLPIAIPPETSVPWTLVRARGEDAATFLQGQLSCDVTSLVSGDSARGLVLTPAGDVVTSLWCHYHPDGVDLVVRSEVLDQTLSTLRRFLMRTKCTFDAATEAPGPYASVGQQVRLGEPGPAEFARGLSAHSFGRGFVASHVSFTKGCFTGQELVGRLDARGGNTPYRLARLRGVDEEQLDRIARSTGPQGENSLQGITTVVRDQGLTALAVVHRTLTGDEVDVVLDGVRVQILQGGAAVAS